MRKFIKPYGDCSSVGRAIGCGTIGRRFESDQSPEKFSGCSVVRLAHLLWEQGVAGSNPATSTTEQPLKPLQKCWGFLFLQTLPRLFIITHYTIRTCDLRII